MNLYELSTQYTSACDELAELLESGEVDQQTVADTTQALGMELQEKAINVAKYIEGLSADVKVIDEAVKRLNDRKKVIKNKQDRLKEYLKDNMERTEITKIECPYFKLSIKKNPPSVKVLVDDKELPEQYRETKYVAKKKDLKAALDNAAEGDDIHKYAEIVKSTRLSID